MLRGSTTIITISFEYLPRLHYLNYPDLHPCWPRSSVGRASEDLIRRSWVQTPLRPNFLWPVGTPKFPLIRVDTQGIWCIAVLPTSGTLQLFGNYCDWLAPVVTYLYSKLGLSFKFSGYILFSPRVGSFNVARKKERKVCLHCYEL